MGKQSARLWYRGKDHKDIVYQNNHHCAMYKGEELVWYRGLHNTYLSLFSSYIPSYSKYWAVTYNVEKKIHSVKPFVDFIIYTNETVVLSTYKTFYYTPKFVYDGKLGSYYQRKNLESDFERAFAIDERRLLIERVENEISDMYIAVHDENDEYVESLLVENVSAYTPNGCGHYAIATTTPNDNNKYILDCNTGLLYENNVTGNPLFYYNDFEKLIEWNTVSQRVVIDGKVVVVYTLNVYTFDGSRNLVLQATNIGSNVVYFKKIKDGYVFYDFKGKKAFVSTNLTDWKIYNLTDNLIVPLEDYGGEYKYVQIRINPESRQISSEHRMINASTCIQELPFFENGNLAESNGMYSVISLKNLTYGSYIGLYLDNYLFRDSENNNAKVIVLNHNINV